MATQYQEDLPVVRPIVRRFDIEVGHCSQCRRRVQGRHRLQSSDALGAAGVQLGPEVVALVVRMHTHLGVPLAKVTHLLRTQFGLTVTPGGLAQVLHRTARQAAPTYTALCQQVRESPVVTPDETGWRVGAMRHWLWVFATPQTTVYAIRAGRGFDDAATVLGTDYDGVLVRDGWAPYVRHPMEHDAARSSSVDTQYAQLTRSHQDGAGSSRTEPSRRAGNRTYSRPEASCLARMSLNIASTS